MPKKDLSGITKMVEIGSETCIDDALSGMANCIYKILWNNFF